MAIADEQRKSRNIFQRATQALRYGRDLDIVEQYQVGDIRSASGVYILPGAAVVGDIDAPKVVVAGLVYGYVFTDELVVEDGGQVWGDVYTAGFQMEKGGKVHGWISSQDEKPDSESLSTNGVGQDLEATLPSELDGILPDLPSFQEEAQARAERVAIWRQLQNEAAVAIMARLELEKSFGNRVDEVAGDSLSESSRLRDEVSIFREERSALQGQVETLEEQLADRIETLETTSAELTAVRSLLDDKNEALEELQAVFEQQNLKTTNHESIRHELEVRLAQEIERNEALVERNANLESAMQGSLQHTAEQEEALIRWQELAEVTETKAAGLQDELDVLALQNKESTQVLERVRTQREKLEKEWEKANQELLGVVQENAVLQANLAEQTEKLTALAEQRDKLQESIDILQDRFETQPPEYEQMVEKVEMITANNADLKSRLQKAEREAQEYHEHWLWTKASLDTTCSELDQLRESIGQYDEKIQALQNKVVEQEGVVEDWKNSVGRMTNLLYEAEEKSKGLEKALEEAREKSADSEDKEILQGQVRMQQAQIEAFEAEVNHIQDEIERQSQSLAEMRATLIEREIALNQTQEAAEKQAAHLEHIKRMASKRIRSLEAELAGTKQKLSDLSAWMERRNRRENNE